MLTELEDAGIKISLMTLRRRMYENGLFCRRPAKKPKLTELMWKKRLYWAQLHRTMEQSYWSKVIFSGECRLEAAKFVRRRKGERYSNDWIVHSVKHPPAVMIWSCISAEGPGPIYFVEGTMRSAQYVEVLQNVLTPYLDILRQPKDEYTFVQDGAPCHTARASMNFLNSLNLQVLPWPGNSSDLNPIENCWAYLKYNSLQFSITTINATLFRRSSTNIASQIRREVAILCLASYGLKAVDDK